MSHSSPNQHLPQIGVGEVHLALGLLSSVPLQLWVKERETYRVLGLVNFVTNGILCG